MHHNGPLALPQVSRSLKHAKSSGRSITGAGRTVVYHTRCTQIHWQPVQVRCVFLAPDATPWPITAVSWVFVMCDAHSSLALMFTTRCD